MALFTCKLGNADGSITIQELDGETIPLLTQNLEEQGYHVFSVRKKPLSFLYDSGLGHRRLTSRDLLTFNQELLVLLKAGLPILQVLDALLERWQDNRRFSALIRQIRDDIKGGAALSGAMGRHGDLFPRLYLASIRAGERTGDLPVTIRRYIQFSKRAEMVRKKVIAALIYPTILVVVALAAVLLLLVYVVPTFSQIYADAGSQLPLLTRLLINAASTLRLSLPFTLIGLIVGGFWFRSWSATPGGRYRWDRFKLRLPIVGTLISSYAVAVFTRTLTTLLGSGIPLVEALQIAAGTLHNRFMENRLLESVRFVEEGSSLTAALERIRLFPTLALRMLGVGETTGSLEDMLSDIAEHLEAEIEERLHLLTTAIEPAIMIIMGVLIGGIIVAMYLPVFKIAGTIG